MPNVYTYQRGDSLCPGGRTADGLCIDNIRPLHPLLDGKTLTEPKGPYHEAVTYVSVVIVFYVAVVMVLIACNIRCFRREAMLSRQEEEPDDQPEEAQPARRLLVSVDSRKNDSAPAVNNCVIYSEDSGEEITAL